MPAMDRREADRAEMQTMLVTHDRADGYGRVGWAKRRGADRRYVHPAELREAGKRVEIGGLALIRRHARGGVALQVLNRYKALSMSLIDISKFHVVLEIDECFAGDCAVRAGDDGDRREVAAPEEGLFAIGEGNVSAGHAASAAKVRFFIRQECVEISTVAWLAQALAP